MKIDRVKPLIAFVGLQTLGATRMVKVKAFIRLFIMSHVWLLK
jgi:hypothetical protein